MCHLAVYIVSECLGRQRGTPDDVHVFLLVQRHWLSKNVDCESPIRVLEREDGNVVMWSVLKARNVSKELRRAYLNLEHPQKRFRVITYVETRVSKEIPALCKALPERKVRRGLGRKFHRKRRRNFLTTKNYPIQHTSILN